LICIACQGCVQLVSSNIFQHYYQAHPQFIYRNTPGEIHSDWREVIANGVAEKNLPVSLSSPNTSHEDSDDCGAVILGMQEIDQMITRNDSIRTNTLLAEADVVVVRFGDKYRQWNAAFDAGYASALGKPLITLHPSDIRHMLKEVNASASAVCQQPEQVIQALAYVIKGELPQTKDGDAWIPSTNLLAVHEGRKVTNGCGNEPLTLPPWEVVLLVDDREPIEYVNRLIQAGVRCERRRLEVFDFLLVARLCTDTTTVATAAVTKAPQEDEFVLGHACERKKINDLANSLNGKNKSTGFTRSVFQNLKMNHSGIENTFYIVQGEIKDLYSKYFDWYPDVKRQVRENIRTMGEDGHTVVFFPLDAETEIVDFLRDITRQIELQFANKQPPDTHGHEYTTLAVMTNERINWVTRLCSSRGTLDEKMIQQILNKFPTSFETEYNRDSASVIQRLAYLKTDKEMGISIAETLCTDLFGVDAAQPRTEQAPKATNDPPPHLLKLWRSRARAHDYGTSKPCTT
jgi:YtoQ family protein